MGIAAFARTRGWLLEEMSASNASLKSIRQSRPDGIIAHILDAGMGRQIEKLNIPAVNLSSTQTTLKLPSIDADQHIVGALAAEYFLDRGYQHYAFFGSPTAAFSKERENGYIQALEDCHKDIQRMYLDYTLRPPYEPDLLRGEESVCHWLEKLPKPVAIFCSNDEHARIISSLCQITGLNVPDQVAILGVDNDETMCLLASPPISSIDNPAEKIGYRGATMLDEMMTKSKRQVPNERISPLCIIERTSTNRFASEDPISMKAISYIERNFKHPTFSVQAVAEHVGCSRRSLERLFHKELGMTVLSAIQRAKIRRAKSLLRNNDIQIQLIAYECGFSNHRRFGIVFKAETKMTPSEFRAYYSFGSTSA